MQLRARSKECGREVVAEVPSFSSYMGMAADEGATAKRQQRKRGSTLPVKPRYPFDEKARKR